jgi:hypothetical protein
MDRDTLFRTVNEGIIDERRSAFRCNLGKNLQYIGRYGGLKRVVPLLSGRHVVIIGAGPSLDEHGALLKKYQSRQDVVYIAADMALAPLAAAGIAPRFVISCETTPIGFFNGLPTEKLHLLAFSCMSHVNLRQWKGDMSFYNWMLHRAPYDELWRIAGEDLGSVATGSIVTSQAVSLALGCPIKSLVLAGNDMGFRRRYYAAHAVSARRFTAMNTRYAPPESLEAGAIRRARAYEVHRGGMTWFTSGQFLAARLWLEELLKTVNVPVYDAGMPGCDGNAVRKITLKRYFELLEDRPRRR